MSRISRAYFPNTKRPSDSPSHYAFMFIRDVHTGIMPFRKGRDYPFEVKLTRKNKKLEKLLNDFLSIGERGSWSLDETIWEITDTLSHYLAALGETHLEVVYDDDKNQDGLAGKNLVFLPRSKISRVPGYYVQIVPLKDWKRGEKKVYLIPAERIWHVKLPRRLGTSRQHRRMLKKLNKPKHIELLSFHKQFVSDPDIKKQMSVINRTILWLVI